MSNNDKYCGTDPNDLKLLVSSDVDTNSETLVASTRCVYNALRTVKTITVPNQEGNSGKQLMTNGEEMFWGGGNIWSPEEDYIPKDKVYTDDGRVWLALDPSGPNAWLDNNIVGPQDPKTDKNHQYWVSLEDYLKENTSLNGFGLPIGYMFNWPYRTPPAGCIEANGELVRRDINEPLWKYLERHPEMVKSDAEWHEIANSSNGYCTFYSSGDNVSTFRTPKFAPYMQLTHDHNTVGNYIEPGLPNITGTTAFTDNNGPSGYTFKVVENQTTGAFFQHDPIGTTKLSGLGNSSQGSETYILGFDASKSDFPGAEIFGKSNTVVPESQKWIVCIVSYQSKHSDDGITLDAISDTLEEFRRTTESVLPLGHIFGWPFKTPPKGSLIMNGAVYDRKLYPELWQYITENESWLKTETEWEKIASSSNGYVPYYSDGDGTSTFRVPKFAPFQCFSPDKDPGTYMESGLPNITGELYNNTDYALLNNAPGNITSVGALSVDSDHNGYVDAGVSQGAGWCGHILLNAANSSPVYGKSNTVQPESNVWLMCVVAYSHITNTATADIAQVQSACDRVQSELETKLTNTVPHLVKAWASADKLSWYRLYSDGWVEQGGNMNTVTGGWKQTTVTFHIPFQDKNRYTLHVDYPLTPDYDGGSCPCVGVKETTHFTIGAYNVLTSGVYPTWWASGYTTNAS